MGRLMGKKGVCGEGIFFFRARGGGGGGGGGVGAAR